MPLIKLSDGSELNYKSKGQGDAVVFISGLNGKASFWDEQLTYFSRYFQVITFDHRGFGKSSNQAHEPETLARLTGDVASLLDALGIETAHFVGHSLGGAIAQSLAADYPETIKSLVLSATWLKPDDRLTRIFLARQKFLTIDGLRHQKEPQTTK
ncbi:alpha/beta fold hydrolase [Endozoicomonas montiporae]|uniref:Alpha/beta hydrolase fold protein n=1 Tax=Endozoicomonas montiporae CL-33 TaxID=570277 RepID=A0A142BG77_9GAMM|nr:alpha/beta fold hydrolase [Endozoicomonas montiporae]AMO57753.1 alpha/beta hydrolase fold protein [Endozoicomonas montiporae CL-33]